LLTADTAGGVWTFGRELAASLILDGQQVLLATFGPTISQAQRDEIGSIPGLEWRHHFSKLEWMDDPWADMVQASRWLSRMIAEFHPDLVHLNTFCCSDVPPDAAVVLTVHSSVAAWWGAVKQSPLPASWSKYQRLLRHSLRSATLITAPSKTALEETSDYYDADVTSALAIYNGSDSRVFTPAVKERFILSAGRLWDEAKNTRALAEVAPEIQWPVYLAGRSEGTFPQCHLLGEIPNTELARWYGRASIYALPAKYEPFGLSVLEAALSGCALVLGDIPSLREIWQDAAVFVSPGSPQELRNALSGLIEREQWRHEMANRARERALYFSQERMVAAYQNAYEVAINRHTHVNWRRACAS